MAKAIYVANDGRQFDTLAEANEHDRRPLVIAALLALQVSPEMADWLYDAKESVLDAFDTGSIKRMSKKDAINLDKALTAVAALGVAGGKVGDIDLGDLAFLVEFNEDAKLSFKFKTQPRLSETEKAIKAKTVLTEAGADEQMIAWIIENREALQTAYKAGNRQVSEKARDALETYQEEQAALRAEKAAELEAKRAELLAAVPSVIFSREHFCTLREYKEYQKSLK